MSTARLIRTDAPLRKDRYKRAGSSPPCPLPPIPYLPANTPRDDARAHLTNSLSTLGASVDHDLRERITTIHSNAGALENQSKLLRSKTATLQKTTKQWGGMADSARGKLKEIGDVQNWAEMIEADLMLIEETLRIVGEDEEGL